MRLQTLFMLNLANAVLACGFPLPLPNAFAKNSILDARAPEPMGSRQDSELAPTVIAGDNGYTDNNTEFYVRSVEPASSL